jgi:cytochrome c553
MKWVLEILMAIGVLSMNVSTLAQESKDVPRVYTAEQAIAGEREVQNNTFGRCSDCHANGLAGRNGDPDELPPLSSLPEATQTLVRNGGKVPQLAGKKFVQRWATRSTKDLSAEMRRRFAGPLSEETQLNIMAYILQLNGALPGSQPLTQSTDVAINRLAK